MLHVLFNRTQSNRRAFGAFHFSYYSADTHKQYSVSTRKHASFFSVHTDETFKFGDRTPKNSVLARRGLSDTRDHRQSF